VSPNSGDPETSDSRQGSANPARRGQNDCPATSHAVA